MPAIGIDLGTTHCRAGVWQQGKVKIILDDQGNRQIPCFVAFTDTERLIGNAAKNQVTSNPSNTIYDVKRLTGRKLNDKTIQNALKHWPFDLIDDSGKLKIQVKFRGEKKEFSPHEVISMILKEVKQTAEAFLDEEVKDAVISVPACFTSSQRQETEDAAKAAGFNVLWIMNESCASALAYSLNKKFQEEKNILILDLGASKCDVSIISIYNIGMFTFFNAKSTADNSQLGGEDFDSKMVKHFCEELRQKYHKDIKSDPCALKKLRIAAEEAKRTLTLSTEASIEIKALYDGIDFYTKISRTTFEDICANLFRSTLNYVEQALFNANLKKELIHDVVLVGGSTHIPKIQSLLQNFFGIEKINLSINSYEAVACGAALQAAILNDEWNKSSVLQGLFFPDVVTSSLGIETTGGVMTPVIRRNECCFPCTRTRRFKTSFCDQLGLSIQVFKGEQRLAKKNEFIGQFELEGITLTPSSPPMIDITFDLDTYGTLHVTAVNAKGDCNEDIPTLVNFHPKCLRIQVPDTSRVIGGRIV